MKYGVIGTGWITEAFVRSCDTVPGMELTAVCSRAEETGSAFAERVGRDLTVYTDPEMMAKDPEIEGVYIASPNRFHYQHCMQILMGGKHVLVEKPAVVSAHQLRRLERLAGQRGLVFMEAIMMVYLPQRRMIKDTLPEIGRIYGARIHFEQLSSKLEAYKAGQNPNIFNPYYCTGALVDIGVYCVYAALDLFGRPKAISACADFLDNGADCSGEAVFHYPKLNLTLGWSKVGQSHAPSEILGDKGTLTIGSISQLTDIHLYRQERSIQNVADNRVQADTLIFGEADRVYAMRQEAMAFCERVQGIRTQSEEEHRLMLDVQETIEVIRVKAGIPLGGNDARH